LYSDTQFRAIYENYGYTLKALWVGVRALEKGIIDSKKNIYLGLFIATGEW